MRVPLFFLARQRVPCTSPSISRLLNVDKGRGVKGNNSCLVYSQKEYLHNMPRFFTCHTREQGLYSEWLLIMRDKSWAPGYWNADTDIPLQLFWQVLKCTLRSCTLQVCCYWTTWLIGILWSLSIICDRYKSTWNRLLRKIYCSFQRETCMSIVGGGMSFVSSPVYFGFFTGLSCLNTMKEKTLKCHSIAQLIRQQSISSL